MPLIVILAECGVELIPKRIRNHSSIRKNITATNYASQLLDNALHHSAMKDLADNEKRGRPDITHVCLLNALGSPLNKTGNLKVYIHTVKNKIFEINPDIRISRNFNRFKGLMAKLIIDGIIGTEEDPLISKVERTLEDIIKAHKDSEIYLFSRTGKLIPNVQNIFAKDISKNNIVIIGGFQKGSFSKQVKDLSDKLIAISEFPLDAWVVVSRIITYYELIHNIT